MEVNCPFCGVDLPSSQVSALTAVALGVVVLLGAAACSPGGSASDGGGTTTSHEGSTEGSTTIDDTSDSGMSTETDTEDSTDDPTDSGGSFYAGAADVTDQNWPCDQWQQDCPEGEKCVPYASTGGSWNSNKCVPILGDGAPGDACSYDGPITATDTCDASSWCWNVMENDGELVGTCTPFCEGTPDNPQCPADTVCLFANDASISICVPECNPLIQDCPLDLACTWAVTEFSCVPAGDEPLNQPCDQIGDCPAGSLCTTGENVPGCAGNACCTAFCSLSEPECEGPASECVPFFADPPAGYEDVGICVGP